LASSSKRARRRSVPRRHALLAERIVDASGDCDVARFAGAPTRKTAQERMLRR
jgi:hypothetical protein